MLITICVKPDLNEEVFNRAIVISLVFDEKIAAEALRIKSFVSLEEKMKLKTLWRVIDSLIKLAEVVIPFMREFVDAMKNMLWDERILRDIDRFLGLVVTSAL